MLFHCVFRDSVSPRALKAKTETMQVQIKSEKKKIYRATDTIKRLKKRVVSLKDVVADLRCSKFRMSQHAEELLTKTYSGVPQTVMSRMLKSIRSGIFS